MKSHLSLRIFQFPELTSATAILTRAVVCWLKPTLLCLTWLVFTLVAVQAAPLTLSKAPPSATGNEPRPNVIVTVDDSGSMDQDVNGNNTSTTANKKITLLKNALTATFSDTTLIPDDRIRLAWQSMHDNGNFISGNGASSIKLGAKNSMKMFSGSTSGTHRQNFAAFVNGLTPNSDTPSMDMMRNVYGYMNAPENVASPWADDPTVTTRQSTPYLTCRRTFHIFMTDGLWNSLSLPSCTNGGRANYSTSPPTCDNSSAGQCPSGYSDNTRKSSDPNKACMKSSNRSTLYSPKIPKPNTSVWSTAGADQVPNGDGVSQTLPDGTDYVATSANTQIHAYRDAYGDDPRYASTLSDFVFRNWATDLQDGNAGTTQTNSAGVTISGPTQPMNNEINPAIRRKGVETVTDPVTHNSTLLEEYWNPKNDPASWQHITQYMIGFGNDATNWGTAPRWDSTSNSTYGSGGDYASLVNGSVAWPNVQTNSTSSSVTTRAAELWHGAIDGRGKYIPAVTGDALAQAFKDIMVEVLKDTSKPLITVTTSSSTLRTGTNAFVAGYRADTWAGQLMARELDAIDASILAGVTWDAVALLDDPAYVLANRFVMSYNGSASFSWKTYSSLPTAQQTPLNKNSAGTVDGNGQNRVDFIRGERSKEQSEPGGIFRDRSSRLGDIVNSNLWYVGKPASGYSANGYATFRGTATGGKGGRTPMVYLGANDGMLHGVATATNGAVAGGTELLAYIPQGIAEGKLRLLTDANYLHEYFVDGTPFTGDAYITTPARNSSGWTTVLVGSLGAGGKGYFVLDATDPADFTEHNVANLVIKDTTGGSVDADIGVITSLPVVDDAISSKSRQVVQMNNGRWAVVLGNGYNSANEAPVLLIQYLDGDKSIKKVSPCAAPIASTTCSFKGSNGLSSPQLIDLNGDGKVDVAYAGDLQGNLWKFNLTSATESNWGMSFGGQPFFVAKGRASPATRPSATVTQAITSAPYWMPHPLGGIMVSVGTGRNLTVADQTSTNVDSYYALWDNSSFSTSGSVVTLTDTTPINTTSSTTLPTTTGGLVQQTITATVSDGWVTYYASSNNAVDYASKRGWYLDLAISGGERVLLNTRLFSGETIVMTSTVPKTGATNNANESCTASATAEANFLYLLNMFTGEQPTGQTFDLVAATHTTALNIVTMGGGDTAIVEGIGKKFVVKSDCAATATCQSTMLTLPQFPGRRLNWRQKQ